MILSKYDLIKAQEEYNIVSPLAEQSVQPNSIDLCISDRFLKMAGFTDEFEAVYEHLLYMQSDESGRRYDDFIFIRPHSFVLGTTIETVNIPLNLMGTIVGRSSIARLGIQIECAGLVDTGFKGQLTLEIKNMTDKWVPIKKYARVAQLRLETISTPLSVEDAYNGKYQGQKGATGSRIVLDY